MRSFSLAGPLLFALKSFDHPRQGVHLNGSEHTMGDYKDKIVGVMCFSTKNVCRSRRGGHYSRSLKHMND